MRTQNAHIALAAAVAISAAIPLGAFRNPAWAGSVILPYTEEALPRGLSYEIMIWPGNIGQYQGFGSAIVDLDNDGDQDIVIMGRADGVVGFFENTGAGAFIDRSTVVDDLGNIVPRLVATHGSGIAAADYDGDGLIDLYITQHTYMPNFLMRNRGDFNFVNVAAVAGVDNLGFGQGASWGDYDNDGWLDLYVCNYTSPGVANNPIRRNQLYRNLGDGQFQNVGAALGVDSAGLSFIAAWSDIDRNGTLDLYLANDRGDFHIPNQMWRNDGGSFVSLCPESRTCLALFAMCVAAGDFDGNGFPDFYVTNLPSSQGYFGGINPLFLNNGDTTFIESAQLWQVHNLSYSWAGIFFDYNNDGWLDLYVNNLYVPNRLYHNTGSSPAVNVTIPCAVGGSSGYSFNTSVGDIDGDGDLDMLLNNYGVNKPVNVQLFINHDGATRNWARFNVVGTTRGNRHAIGANLDLRTADRWQFREIFAGANNFKSQNELVFHFGLDDASIIDELVVRWPGGSPIRTLTNYSVNKVWTIHPPSALGDADANGLFNVVDLLAIVNAWGPVQPGTEICDTNGDGVIDVIDLLFVINHWS